MVKIALPRKGWANPFPDEVRTSSRVVLFLVAMGLLDRRIRKYAFLHKFPGPVSYALTRAPMTFPALRGRSTLASRSLHGRYGPLVRVRPNQLSFSTLSALDKVRAEPFEKIVWHENFDVYGRPTSSRIPIRWRHATQAENEPRHARVVLRMVFKFVDLLRKEPTAATNLFKTLHYFSLNVASEMVYGNQAAPTAVLEGDDCGWHMIEDILHPRHQRWSWLLGHWPRLTTWLIARPLWESSVFQKYGLPIPRRPTAYPGVGEHAWESVQYCKAAFSNGGHPEAGNTLVGRLLTSEQQYSDVDVAAECAGRLLTRTRTTSSALVFLFWTLSLPQHHIYQLRTREEILRLTTDEHGQYDSQDLLQLPYLNAVVRETVRRYVPLAHFAPRTCAEDQLVDGHLVPAQAIVSTSSWTS